MRFLSFLAEQYWIERIANIAPKHIYAYYHKADIQDVDSDRPMSFHGIRHTCAAEWYVGFIKQGLSELEACRKVAHLLGHGRDDVTRIYLASLPYRTTPRA